MKVRDVEWSDFPDLLDIYYHLYDERAQGDPIGITLFSERPSHADEIDWFARAYARFERGVDVWSVAESDGRVVGNCTIQRLAPVAGSEQAHIGILGILVHHSHRGQGVGTALLTHALAAARRRFEVVRLSVFSINTGARRLYERFGFVTTGHSPRAVKRDGAYLDEEEMTLVFESGPTGAANA